MPKKVKRNKNAVRRTLLIFVLCVLFLAVLTVPFFKKIWIKQPLFISPLSTISQDKKTRAERLLLNARIAFSSISLNADSSYLVRLQDGGEIILSAKKDIQGQISSLQPILKQLTIEGERFKRLDFRFDKPIVVF